MVSDWLQVRILPMKTRVSLPMMSRLRSQSFQGTAQLA